ncbi:MAG TPA: dTDP-4-dehydrorhamnose 3,5-epimerase [Alphaproteobacteria bacterium]|jgi:dTDP-4-dehydrorhamnose 3,5-epimerase
MIFTETRLAGAFVIEPEPATDERGLFARTFCAREFAAHGIETAVAQCSASFNKHKGTLRGLHYQAPPHNEAKLVRVTAGAIYDVAVDLREGSPTYGQWAAAELTAENRRMFFIPKGCAHGFQTLRDDSEVFYQIAEFYEPASARGLRWDDPELAIAWPDRATPILSERDRGFPGLRDVTPVRP